MAWWTKRARTDWCACSAIVSASSTVCTAPPVNTVSARGISGFQMIIKHYEEYAPLRRSVEPAEVGRAALFLLSDMGSGITGTTLHVDAGYSIVGL